MTWLEQTFKYEYCHECGGDAEDHFVVVVMGNYCARCKHPIMTKTMTLEEFKAELARRIKRKDAGLSLVEEEHAAIS